MNTARIDMGVARYWTGLHLIGGRASDRTTAARRRAGPQMQREAAIRRARGRDRGVAPPASR